MQKDLDDWVDNRFRRPQLILNCSLKLLCLLMHFKYFNLPGGHFTGMQHLLGGILLLLAKFAGLRGFTMLSSGVKYSYFGWVRWDVGSYRIWTFLVSSWALF